MDEMLADRLGTPLAVDMIILHHPTNNVTSWAHHPSFWRIKRFHNEEIIAENDGGFERSFYSSQILALPYAKSKQIPSIVHAHSLVWDENKEGHYDMIGRLIKTGDYLYHITESFVSLVRYDEALPSTIESLWCYSLSDKNHGRYSPFFLVLDTPRENIPEEWLLPLISFPGDKVKIKWSQLFS